MRLHGLFLGFCVLWGALPNQPGKPTFTPDEEGFLRDWLVLAPLPLAEGQGGTAGLNNAGLPDEAALTPKPGQEVRHGDRRLTWRALPGPGQLPGFQRVPRPDTEDCVAYAVCYLWLEREAKHLQLKMGSDDQAKVYLNGKELLKAEQPRP